MLVLSRKVGEKLVIGDQITVVVNRVSGNRISLGIDAPPHVRIVRGELHSRCGSAAASPVEAQIVAADRTDGDNDEEEESQAAPSIVIDWPATAVATALIGERTV
jgi:carbon storage regulator